MTRGVTVATRTRSLYRDLRLARGGISLPSGWRASRNVTGLSSNPCHAPGQTVMSLPLTRIDSFVKATGAKGLCIASDEASIPGSLPASYPVAFVC